MRITQLLTYNGLQKHLNRNREELAKFQEQLSSGKSVVRASDDNVSFTTSRLIRESVRRNEQYSSNIDSGLSYARNSQDALDGMIDLMIELKKIGVQGASDSLDARDRTILADQVKNVKERIMDLGNSSFNGVYLFGGSNTGQPPLYEDVTPAPGDVHDRGNSKPLKIRISDSSRIETTISTGELRNTASGDMFAIIKDLEDGLRANNGAQVNAKLGEVEDALNHVVSLSAKIGNNINRMQFVSNQIESKNIEQSGAISRLTDTDYAEAMVNFKKFETGYEAALAAHARMAQTTLLKYI